MTNPRKSNPPTRWFQFRASPPNATVVLLGIAVWSIFFAIWEAASLGGMLSDLLMPSPHHVLATLINLLSRTDFLWDITASVTRILVSFLAACLIAVPLGIAMGAFGTMEAFWNPFVAAWRYLPAPAFIPVLLMWFGTGEGLSLSFHQAVALSEATWSSVSVARNASRRWRSSPAKTLLSEYVESRSMICSASA